MTTASTSHFAAPIVPIRWLNFDRPADLRTFPDQALPIAMQCAVRDRQREMMHVMPEEMASTVAEVSGTGERLEERTVVTVVATGSTPTARRLRVAIVVADPWDCLVSAIAAHGLRWDVFLCDPSWSEAERAAVFAQVQPAMIVRDRPRACPQPSDPSSPQRNILPAPGVTLECRITDPKPVPFPNATPNRTPPETSPDRDPYWAIPTGGTSGRIRFACHTWQTLTASAIGVRDFFQRDRLNSFCCLPVFHVSGLAQVVRAIMSGGQLALTHPSALHREQNPHHIAPDRDLHNFWLSLVPTQLQRLIDCPAWLLWLQQFDVIFLGGAPAWGELLATARSQGLRLAPTFGMTETASQIATLHPADFLAGRTGCGQILPHARLNLAHPPDPDIASSPNAIPDPEHQPSQSSQTPGLITIRARSLFLGYYDANLEAANPTTAAMPWQSDDLGYFDADGSLQIVGRASQKVITGGENVYPEEVEAAIRETGLVRDVAVIGLPDREWGQSLAAVYVAWETPIQDEAQNNPDRRANHGTDCLVAQLRDRLAAKLARYKIPKHWLAIDQLPRNDRGKLDRTTLAQRFTPDFPEPD